MRREGAHDDLFEAFGDGAIVEGGGEDLDVADFLQGGEFIGADEEAFVGEHLVQQDANTKDIGASVDGQSHDLFGSHVAEFPFEDARFGVRAFGGGFGDPKVDDLHLAFVGNDDILGRDIAVNDVEFTHGDIFVAVSVVESFADFGDDVNDKGDGEGRFDVAGAIDQAADIAAVDVFHRDKKRLANAAEFVYLGDIGVVKRDGDPRLVDEHLGEFGIACEVRQDAFDRDESFDAFEACDFGAEDFRHPADIKSVEQQVITKTHWAMLLRLFLAQRSCLSSTVNAACMAKHKTPTRYPASSPKSRTHDTPR